MPETTKALVILSGLVQLEEWVKFVENHKNDVLDNIPSSEYLPTRMWATYVGSIRLRNLCIRICALPHLLEGLRTKGEKEKNKGILHPDCLVLSPFEPNEVETWWSPQFTSTHTPLASCRMLFLFAHPQNPSLTCIKCTQSDLPRPVPPCFSSRQWKCRVILLPLEKSNSCLLGNMHLVD